MKRLGDSNQFPALGLNQKVAYLVRFLSMECEIREFIDETALTTSWSPACFYIDQFVQSVTNEHLLPSCPPHNEPPPVVIQSRQPSNSWREQLSKMSPLEHTVTDDTTKT